MKQGKNVYGINVVVQDSCILKAARAFLVFKAVEEKGEIIVSVPSAQDVEDEKFDKDFTLIVLSDYSLDDVIKAAESVSEIAPGDRCGSGTGEDQELSFRRGDPGTRTGEKEEVARDKD